LKNDFPETLLVVGDINDDPRLGYYYDIKATP